MSDAQRTYYGPDWLPAGGLVVAVTGKYDSDPIVNDRVRAQLDYLCGKPAEPVTVLADAPSSFVGGWTGYTEQPHGVAPHDAMRAYEATAALAPRPRGPHCTLDEECLRDDGHAGPCYIDEYM